MADVITYAAQFFDFDARLTRTAGSVLLSVEGEEAFTPRSSSGVAVYGYLLRTTGRPDEAEELTEVFLRVVKELDGYEDRNCERAWLFRIARNLRRDAGRREGRRPPTSSLDETGRAVPARPAMPVSLACARGAAG